MTSQTDQTSETGVTDRRTEGKTGINLEWLAPLKIKATFTQKFLNKS